jgi:hypothetical protein
MLRWRTAGADQITDGITVRNTIWGPGWDEDGVDSTNIIGYTGLESTLWTFENSYSTNNLTFVTGANEITGFNYTYDGTPSDLWYSDTTGNFNYADTTFNGIGNAGDQRWAEATEDGGRVWNISRPAYKDLGTLDSTHVVAGLSIIANPDKTITIDANNKTVDNMTFTSRLKFGGSGQFDDNGQPLGRVVSIDVNGNTSIMVAAMSSSSSSDRVLNIAAGHKDSIIAEFPALGASLTMGQYTYTGGATKLFFYSPSSGVNLYYLRVGHIAGTDATLSALSVSGGILSPDFDADITAYEVELPVGATTVTVNATATDPLATVEGTGEIDVSSGSATATVTVTAEDGTTIKEYTLNMAVAKNDDASLLNLTVSAGILNPFFDSEVFDYSVLLTGGTSSVTVVATTNDGNATVTGDGEIDVSSGSATATVVVTAEDGTTTATYTVAFTVLTGIENDQGSSMRVYPTVSNGYFQVDFAGKPGMIRVFDLTGRQVVNRTADSSIETIHVDRPGIYLFRLDSENESITVRVISVN